MRAGLAFFLGFYLAMGLANAISAAILRSAASACYALLMAVMAGLAFVAIPNPPIGGAACNATLVAAYLTCVAAFAFALLRSWRYDRPIAWACAVLLLVNYPLIYGEALLRGAWPFHTVGQAALDALLILLIVLGVRAVAHEGWIVAGCYLAGFAGASAGIVLDDLAQQGVLQSSLGYVLAFYAGGAWEAAFFAYAVAIRNRAIASERDRFAGLARLDGLTGVANRRTFDEELERLWALARRARVPLAVAMLDIDRFKEYNDEYGHLAGDDVLRNVAGVGVSALRRGGDCFARYGGEEFAAILYAVDDSGAASLSERVRAQVERECGITVSVGVASRVPSAGESATSLVADADAGLYRAKERGRNRVVSTTGDPDSARRLDRRLGRS
ncbi:MAG TPA: diguanylate cyclase [Verrucomicrobiae bacterium]|nr:diguanylate cyclase [Verrucomicrobiae bacterium]